MLKLVFYTKDLRLKVRHAFAHDDFSSSCTWEDKLEYIVTNNGDFSIVWTSFLPDLDPEYAEALVELVGARYPISSQYDKLKDSCSDMSYQLSSDEWVFFGGSFNPWHQGHQSCLNLIPEDKTCFIVPDRNPQKELRDESCVTEVLELSANARIRSNQFIVPTFLLEKKHNPTVEWVERLKDLYPTQKISLLMGFDSFSQIKGWIRAEDLLPKLFSLYVVSRMEDDEDRRQALDEVHARGSNLNVVFLGRHEHESISSTEIRFSRS